MRYGPFGDSPAATLGVSLAIVALLTALVGGGSSLPGAVAIGDLAADLRTGLLIDVMRAITDLGAGLLVSALLGIVAIGLLSMRRWAELAITLTGALLIGLGIPELKDAIARARPEDGLLLSDTYAFPSGHAAHSVAYVYLALLAVHFSPEMTRRGALLAGAFALAFLIGISRIYLGVHHLEDVLAGWAFGAGAFTLWPAARLARSRLRHNLHGD